MEGNGWNKGENMGTEGRNRIGQERKDENERNGVKADHKKGDKRKRVETGGKLEENERKEDGSEDDRL